MTTSLEQRVRVRSLFFAEHWKVGTIASELSLHPDTVKALVGTQSFVSRGAQARAHLLTPFAPFIAQTLEKHPRLRASRLFEMLLERGYEGSHRQLRRYVAKVRPKNLRRTVCRSDLVYHTLGAVQ